MTCQTIQLLNKEYSASETGVIEFLSELEILTAQQQWSLESQNHWALIGEEIVTNIAKYAYPSPSPDNRFQVVMSQRDQTVVTEFVDWGQPFNPLSEETPKPILSIEDMPIGGLGVVIVKKLADHLQYQRKDEKNWLLVEKQLNSTKIDR